MERRHFLKLAFGFAAGAAALSAGIEAEAAPLAPQPLAKDLPPENKAAEPAVTTGDEVDRLSPDEVRWGRGRGRGWGRRRWGWRRRGWRRRRYWGFRRRYWRRRRRYWRRRYW
jgi:hypothetical protein